MKTGLATQKKLSEPAVDFPRINESYTGRYVSNVVTAQNENPHLIFIVKLLCKEFVRKGLI